MEKPLSTMNLGMRWSTRDTIAACAVGCLLYGASPHASLAQEFNNSLMHREVAKRSEALILAKQLLLSGDSHYNKKEYKEAVADYSQAFVLVPNAGLARDVRFIIADRYAQAAVEYAKELAKNGSYDDAKSVLNKVLESNVAPGHVGAMTLLAQIDDPTKYNAALTPEHVRRIEQVAHWLRKAEGYHMLGQYDQALVAYEEVIRLDKHNSAARRGMEKVVQAVRDYSRTAADHARSEMLKEVDEAWEIKADTVADLGGAATPGGSSELDLVQEIRGNKLKQILIPVVDFQDANIEEAMDTLRLWSREFDASELDPTKKGFNFVLRIGDSGSELRDTIVSKSFSLKLYNTPMSKVLDYVTKATGTQWRIDEYAIVITPSGMQDTQLHQRSFTVPPSFMQDSVAGGGVADSDPFAEDSSGSALRPQLSTEEYLKRIGVSFPEGATASYIRGVNQLNVRNTETNLNIIEDYFRSLRKQESVQVVINFTIIDIAQTDLEELGFDWLLGQNNLSGNELFLGGGSQGSGSPVGALNGVTDVDPITAGNRSGESMFETDAIDDRISGISNSGQTALRAPGVLQVTGLINNSTFQTIMRGLDQKKEESRIITPSLIVRSGEKARIYSGNQLIYPTDYEPAELPNTVFTDGVQPVTPSTPTAFETRELGFQFDIEPTISDDRNYIELRLNPIYTEFDGFIDYGAPINSVLTNASGQPSSTEITSNSILVPIFSTIRLNTSVTLQDGATMVVGGLHQSRIDKVDDKVPVLGDLPFIGRFFQSSGYRPSKRAMIMFVNAKLVDPTGKSLTDR